MPRKYLTLFFLILLVSSVSALTVSPLHINTGNTTIFISSDSPSDITVSGAGITADRTQLPAGNSIPLLVTVSDGASGSVLISGASGSDGSIKLRSGIQMNVGTQAPVTALQPAPLEQGRNLNWYALAGIGIVGLVIYLLFMKKY